MKRIGNIGINTSFIIQKSKLKKKLIGGSCQEDIDKEIDGKHDWLQLVKVIQSIEGKGISTLLGRIPTKEVVIKIQEADKGSKEYEIQDKLKDFDGFIKFECLFFCQGDKKYIESFANLQEHKQLCKAKGFSMGIILMPYYKKGSLENYGIIQKDIISTIILNYFNAYDKTGFIHADLFPKNIVLDDHENPIIIDYENGYFNDKINNHTYFWRDLTDLLSYVKYEKDLSHVIRIHCMMNGAYNKKPTLELINNLINDL
jgi:serine/threonine protein kinase